MNSKQKLFAIAIGCAATLPGCGAHTPAATPPPAARTGAVSTTTGAQLRGGQSVRLDELLRGRAAGLEVLAQPDGSYLFKIRGNLSDNREQQPLIIVDGIEIAPRAVESALAGLTRDDIRKVEVLKDVASTSSYGSRGVGGVILISTNRR